MKGRVLISTIAVIAGAIGLCPLGASANGAGNGGDALRQLFHRAKSAAAAKVENLQWCSFDNSVPQERVKWILDNQAVIADDIHNSHQLWTVDNQDTCGFTEPRGKAAIYLSYPTCASTVGTDLNSAMFVVLHETAHHMGITNEKDADNFARMIQGSQDNVTCQNPPDITNPNTCSSGPMTTDAARKYFKPGDTEEVVPAIVKTYGRINRCTQIGGCEPWKDWAGEIGFSPDGYASQRLDKTFLHLHSIPNAPFYAANLEYQTKAPGLAYSSDINHPGKFMFHADDSYSYRVRIIGPRYRGEDLIEVRIGDDAELGRFRKDCVWNKWVGVRNYAGGVTETAEFYFYGVY